MDDRAKAKRGIMMKSRSTREIGFFTIGYNIRAFRALTCWPGSTTIRARRRKTADYRRRLIRGNLLRGLRMGNGVRQLGGLLVKSGLLLNNRILVCFAVRSDITVTYTWKPRVLGCCLCDIFLSRMKRRRGLGITWRHFL